MRFRFALDSESFVEFVAEGKVSRKIALKIFQLQMRWRLRNPPKHRREEICKDGLTGRAEPLRFMLVAMRLKSDQLRDLRIEPCERVWKRNADKFADVLTLTRACETAASIPTLVESYDQRSIKRRREISAGGMAQMVIEASHAIPSARRHVAYDSKIVQLTAQLARCFIQEIKAGFGRKRREPRSKKNRSRPRASGPGSDSDSINIRPLDSGALQAKLNSTARYALRGACPCQLSLFNRSDQSIFSNDRGSRTMLQRGKPQNMHFMRALSFLLVHTPPAILIHQNRRRIWNRPDE